MINEAAEEILPRIESRQATQPWHNDETLKALYIQKDELISKNAGFKTLSRIRKKMRLRARHLRNEYFKSEAEKMNQLAINREIEKLFAQAKKQETTLRTPSGSCQPEKLLDHFKSHFNPPSNPQTPNELQNDTPNFIEELQNISSQFNINDELPSIEEIKQQIKKLKNNRANNDVSPELLKKCDHPIMLEVIHRMIANLFENLDVPGAWGNSRLKTLWKGKGSKNDPTKYRGLSIGSTVCKPSGHRTSNGRLMNVPWTSGRPRDVRKTSI